MDQAQVTAYLTASSKLLTVLVAFWTRLTQAVTAKEPLNVLFHNWVGGNMEAKHASCDLFTVLNSHIVYAVGNTQQASASLADAICIILVEMVSCGAFHVGQET